MTNCRRNHASERLGQNNMPQGLNIGQTGRTPSLDLSLVDGVQTTADDFREHRSFKYGKRNDR